MKIIFNNFGGINNVNSEEKVGIPTALNDKRVIQDEMAGGQEFVEGINVESYNDGTIQRRSGYTQLVSGSCHSLFSFNDKLIYRKYNGLYVYPNIQIDTLNGGETRYAMIDDKLYYTDGLEVKVYDGKVVRTAGLPIPTKPNISSAVGRLAKGKYQYAITYQNGINESGAVWGSYDGEGAIYFTNLPNAYKVNIYVSHCNGEKLYCVGTTNLSSFKWTGGADGKVLKTVGGHAPIGGQEIAIWNGRLWIANDNYLMWSDVYNYELFDGVRRNIRLENRINLIIKVSKDFMIIGTEKGIYRLSGNKPEEMIIDKISNAKAFQGSWVETQQAEVSGNVAIVGVFMSDDGIINVGADGSMNNLTIGRYKYSGKKAHGIYKNDEGIHQSLWVLH